MNFYLLYDLIDILDRSALYVIPTKVLDVFLYVLFWINEPLLNFISVLFSMIFAYYFVIGVIKLFHRDPKYKINFSSENFKYFSWVFLFFPLWYLIYPIFLWLCKINIKKEALHIKIWVFVFFITTYLDYLFYDNQFRGDISMLIFFPYILLMLFLWKPKKHYFETIKKVCVTIVLILFVAQPIYKSQLAKLEEICYQNFNQNKSCIMIYSGFNLKKYMRDNKYNLF